MDKKGEKHSQNHHGLALAEFMSGYLYANYKSILTEATKEELLQGYTRTNYFSEQKCKKEARTHFENAFTLF